MNPRHLLLRGPLATLAPEICDAIFKEVDASPQLIDTEKREHSHTYEPTRDPAIPPKDGSSPFLEKLPAELRREIFRYLLPEQGVRVEPTGSIQRRRHLINKHSQAAQAAINARTRVQLLSQIAQQGTAHWNYQVNLTGPNAHLNHFIAGQVPALAGQNATAAVIPPLYIPHAFAPVMPLAPLPVQGSFQAPPPTANPLMGWTGAPMQPANPLPLPPVATHVTVPGFGTTVQQLPAQNPHQAVPWAPIQGLGGLPTVHIAPPLYAGSAINQVENLAALNAQKACHELDKYDPTPERLVLALLTTNVKLCAEVSTILYEEYTFEIHIYSDGVEFLHYPRIPTLENWGLNIEKTLGAFKEHDLFCFQRLKHIKFAIHGGDPADRLAGLRMRESMCKLVGFLAKEKRPVVELIVQIRYEPLFPEKEGSLDNCFEDEHGTFWSGLMEVEPGVKDITCSPRGSILRDVNNIELVCSPLKALRKVVKPLEVELPAELLDNGALKQYLSELSIIMQKDEMSNEDLLDIMREEQIMDARRDHEMRSAGAGGYFPHSRRNEGDLADDLRDPRVPLLEEADLIGEGFVRAFDEDDDDMELEEYDASLRS